jgi:hypothetical protein
VNVAVCFVHSRRIFGIREIMWDKRDSALYRLAEQV